MRPLSAAVLLDLWERGHALPQARQALLLLAASSPDEAPEALARLPVGRRDARLLTLRVQTFGDRLDSLVTCPACGEPLALNVPAGSLRAEAPDDAPEDLVLERDGYTVRFRLPTTEDLMAVAGMGGDGAGPAHLLARCVVEAHRDGEALAAADLPTTMTSAVTERMEAADPQARVLLDLTCPACGHRWQSLFDVVSYFWAEIDAWARRTLREVHTLAAAYGWREADILSMSAWRRHHYLTMLHG